MLFRFPLRAGASLVGRHASSASWIAGRRDEIFPFAERLLPWYTQNGSFSSSVTIDEQDTQDSSDDESETPFCFDPDNGYRLVEKEELRRKGRLAGAVLSPSIQITDETESLFRLLPDYFEKALLDHQQKDKLTEIVLDVGRRPFAWIAGERHFIGDSTVTEEQLRKISGSLQFGSDNRAGIDGCLHRISALQNREGNIVGLTLRVGRFVPGNATMLIDLLYGSDASVLFIGAPATVG